MDPQMGYPKTGPRGSEKGGSKNPKKPEKSSHQIPTYFLCKICPKTNVNNIYSIGSIWGTLLRGGPKMSILSIDISELFKTFYSRGVSPPPPTPPKVVCGF